MFNPELGSPADNDEDPQIVILTIGKYGQLLVCFEDSILCTIFRPLLRVIRWYKVFLASSTMDPYEETFHTWNNIASLYQDKFMELDVYNDSYDFICNSIEKPGAKLLELGCGPGNIAKYLLSKRPDFDIFGIDIAPNMIALARLNNPTAHFAVMDSRHINRLETKYDGIIGGFCLPYLSTVESDELISSSCDLLNDHGLIYLSFVEGDPNKSVFKTGSGGRVYFYYHNLENLKAKLIKTKFTDLKTFTLKYNTSETEFEIHTILTARKRKD